jgi:hypothetical protein
MDGMEIFNEKTSCVTTLALGLRPRQGLINVQANGET